MLKRCAWGVLAVVMAGVVAGAMAAGAEPGDEVRAAVKKLADGGNYSWETTTTDSENMAGATDGKTDQGTTTYTAVQFQATSPAVEQGGKLVVRMDDGTWKTVPEVAAAAAEARAAMMAAREAAATQEFVPEPIPRYEPYLYNSVQNLRWPTVDMKEVADRLTGVKKEGAVYTGDLSAEVAADLLMNRRPGAGPASASSRPGSASAGAPVGRPASSPASAPASAPRFRRPEPTNPKGTARFTLKDGVVVKYEVEVSGTFVFGGEERPAERAYTTEFTDIGTTKVTVPAEARAKLAAASGPGRP